MRKLLVALVAFGPTLAFAEPVAITSLDQVQKLCTDLRSPDAKGGDKAAHDAAMQQEYQLTLQPGQYKIGEADPGSGTLSIDTQRAFRLFHGQAVFYPVDEEDLDLAVPEGQPLPQKTDDLALQLVVRPGQDAEQPCTVGLSKDYVMGVEVLSARLVNKSGAAVAALEEDTGIQRAGSTNGQPDVEIEPAVVEGSATMSKTVTDRIAQLRPQLTQCYQQGLQKQPALDGSMVLGFDVSGGKPGQVTVMADSVQDDQVATCVTRAVSGVELGKSAPAPKAAKKNEKASKGGGETYTGRASIALRFARK